MIKNWDRTNTGRLTRIEFPFPNMDDHSDNGENEREEQVAPTENIQNAPQRETTQVPITLWEQRNPPMESTPSCIVLPKENYVVRSQVLVELPTYHGMENENPYTHIRDFQVLCRTTKERTASIETVYFVSFYFKG